MNSFTIRFTLLLSCLFLVACTPRVHSYLFELPNVPEAVSPSKRKTPANNPHHWSNYLPDPAHPQALPDKTVRINVHFIDSQAGDLNFPPDSARLFFKKLIAEANAKLDTNVRNWTSPEGTEILPKRYRYKVVGQNSNDDGFYFHRDDKLYWFVAEGKYQNNYSREVVDKYKIGEDTILNIFVQVHPPDSLRSKRYRATKQGIALGNSLKMTGLRESHDPPSAFTGLMNHEIGHIFSLSHA